MSARVETFVYKSLFIDVHTGREGDLEFDGKHLPEIYVRWHYRNWLLVVMDRVDRFTKTRDRWFSLVHPHSKAEVYCRLRRTQGGAGDTICVEWLDDKTPSSFLPTESPRRAGDLDGLLHFLERVNEELSLRQHERQVAHDTIVRDFVKMGIVFVPDPE